MTQAPDAQDFLRTEYQGLLDKIAYVRTDIARAETIYPLAIAAVYVWILSGGPPVKALWILAMWIPVPIATLGLIKIISRYRLMRVMEDYCIEIEEEFFGSSSKWGWERFYREKRPNRPLSRMRTWVFVGIVIVTVTLALASSSLFEEVSRHRQGSASSSERSR